MLKEYEAAKIFGEYADRLDLICDGDEAARILTLRAATEEGVYRIYTRKSTAKSVYNSRTRENQRLEPIPVEVGLKAYYLIEDVERVYIKPECGRKSKSVAQFQAELDKCLSMEWKVKPSHIEWLRKQLALAQEAQQAVDNYWKDRSEAERKLTHWQRRLDRQPKVANI